MNEQDHLFAWQVGYSAFSVSESNVVAVRKYICGQQEHHRTQSFDEEFVTLLRKHGISVGNTAEKELYPPGEEDLANALPRQ